MGESIQRIQRRIESSTRSSWFLLLFILIGTLTPPFVERGFDPSKSGGIILYILRHALIKNLSPLYPVFKAIPIALLLALAALGNRVGRLFSAYAGVNYLLLAVLQGVAVTDEYGLAILTGNLVLMVFVATLWFWEAVAHRNDFTPRKLPLSRYWVIPLAFLAFWYPANPRSLQPDFNPAYLLTNAAGLAFCMMTPVYLGVLILYYPRVNIATLRVTALLGAIIGFWNMVVNFVMGPLNLQWWNGVLHIPLVLTSAYALYLSFGNARGVAGTAW